MQDLSQQVAFVDMAQGGSDATVSSTAEGDWVNMENHQKVTFVLVTGTVTVGGKIGIRKAASASGTTKSSTAITSAWDGGKFYSGATIATTANSTVSSGAYIQVANSDDSKIFTATFDAKKLSASYPYIEAYFVSSTWNAVIMGTYVMWKTRYQQASMPNPTS